MIGTIPDGTHLRHQAVDLPQAGFVDILRLRGKRAERPDRRGVARTPVWICGNGDVLALINAKLSDQTSRADVMEVTGFLPQRYRTAVSQLNRMAHEVGIELDLITDGNEDGNERT